MHDSDPDVSIVIPCLNEEPLLERSVSEIRQVMDQTRHRYELVLVDDGSTDRTRDIIEKLEAQSPHDTRHLYHAINSGRGRTVVDGLRAARGRIAGFLDIDLEVHARYIPSMIAAIDSGSCDAAIAYRIYKLGPSSLLRGLFTWGYRKLVGALFALPVRDTESGFKFFHREKILPLLSQTRDPGWFWDTEIMVVANDHGLRVREIPCLFIRRNDKPSHVRIIRDSFRYLVSLRRFLKERSGRSPS
jgi:glycosyltransferase involved in cell wall biosynthesis